MSDGVPPGFVAEWIDERADGADERVRAQPRISGGEEARDAQRSESDAKALRTAIKPKETTVERPRVHLRQTPEKQKRISSHRKAVRIHREN